MNRFHQLHVIPRSSSVRLNFAFCCSKDEKLTGKVKNFNFKPQNFEKGRKVSNFNFRFSFSSLQFKLDFNSNAREKNNSEWFRRELFLPSRSVWHICKKKSSKNSFEEQKMDKDWPENSYPNFLWLLFFSVICIYFVSDMWVRKHEEENGKKQFNVGRVFVFWILLSFFFGDKPENYLLHQLSGSGRHTFFTYRSWSWRSFWKDMGKMV